MFANRCGNMPGPCNAALASDHLSRSYPRPDGLAAPRQPLIIAQFILCLPIVINLTAVAVQQLNPKLRLQMRALGASRWQLMWLLGREIRLPLLGAYMAAFGIVVHEVGASQMVGGNLPGSTRVLTTAILMETGMGHYDRAMAYGIVLLLLVGIVAALLTWVQQREALR
jgi:tungstate transport system permease protein